MGVLGFLTGGTIDKGIDVVSKGADLVDKGWLTKEEAQDGFLEYFKLTLSENTERSRTRRFVAMTTIKYFFQYLSVTASFYILAICLDSENFMRVGNTLKSLAIEFNLIIFTGMVFIFFFGTYLAGKLKGKQ
jgi:hypothetical protein